MAAVCEPTAVMIHDSDSDDDAGMTVLVSDSESESSCDVAEVFSPPRLCPRADDDDDDDDDEQDEIENDDAHEADKS